MRLQGTSGNATSSLVDGRMEGFCSKVKLLVTAVHGGFPGWSQQLTTNLCSIAANFVSSSR